MRNVGMTFSRLYVTAEYIIDGTPCAVKVACTVWHWGKSGDNIKTLPIVIVSPIGWYLNDQNKNDELYETIPSTSILICGGTGCYDKDTPIFMYDTLVH